MSVLRFIYLILTVSLIIELNVSASKDRFNIYKGNQAEELTDLFNDEQEARMSYFLRTPQIGWNGPMRVGQNPADFGKRTINAFKNYMLTKENQGNEGIGKEEINPFFG